MVGPTGNPTNRVGSPNVFFISSLPLSVTLTSRFLRELTCALKNSKLLQGMGHTVICSKFNPPVLDAPNRCILAIEKRFCETE